MRPPWGEKAEPFDVSATRFLAGRLANHHKPPEPQGGGLAFEEGRKFVAVNKGSAMQVSER
jgi:hypothetical protein